MESSNSSECSFTNISESDPETNIDLLDESLNNLKQELIAQQDFNFYLKQENEALIKKLEYFKILNAGLIFCSVVFSFTFIIILN